jgi:hypothetical protein
MIDFVKVADTFDPFHTSWYERGYEEAKKTHDTYIANGLVPK